MPEQELCDALALKFAMHNGPTGDAALLCSLFLGGREELMLQRGITQFIRQRPGKSASFLSPYIIWNGGPIHTTALGNLPIACSAGIEAQYFFSLPHGQHPGWHYGFLNTIKISG